jgi:hypothetical protein
VTVRRVAQLAPTLLIAAFVLPALAPAQTTSNPQAVFQRLILNDTRTATSIKTLLRRGSGFVDPGVTFTELTGDSRSDAVVLVQSGGVAGTVGVYVFTSAIKNGGNGTLRAAIRLQTLRRASVTVGGGAIMISSAAYAAGDQPCCPKELVDATYKWDRPTGTFKRTATERRPGPTG